MATHITLEQRRQLTDLEEVASICRVDYWNHETNCTPDERAGFLNQAFRRMVVGFVIETYTLVDDLLSDIIGNIYVGDDISASISQVEFWESKHLASFVHNVLDNLYPLQKVRIIDDIEPFPADHKKTINRMNALRNALAHSFFPEQRRDYRATRTVQYRDKDIFTVEGLKQFDDDRDNLISYLWLEANGEPLNGP